MNDKWIRIAVILTFWTAQPSVATNQGQRGRIVEVEGKRRFIDCRGSVAPTVIIVGGAGTWSLLYQPLQERLSPTARVCTFDPPGFGKSDPGPKPRTASRVADELHQLLHTAAIPGPFVLVGHSFGGYVVQIYQRRYRSEVAAVALIEAGHPRQWKDLPESLQLVKAAIPYYRDAALRAARGEITREEIPRGRFGRIGQELRAEYEAIMQTSAPYEAAADVLSAIETSAAEVPIESRMGLPLVVVTANDSFSAFKGTGLPVARSNEVWLGLQAELAQQSRTAVRVFSDRGAHDLDQSDPEAMIDGIQRAIGLARQRAQEQRAGEVAAVDPIHRLPETSAPEVDFLLRSVEAAYRSMDADALLQFFTDDFEQLDVNRRVLVRGREAWRRQIQNVNAGHEWMERLHHGRILAASGTMVAVELEWSGRVRPGEASGLSPDGEYRYTGLGLIEIVGGRIRRQVFFGDFVSLARQLGLELPTATRPFPDPVGGTTQGIAEARSAKGRP